jgi:hypothetical protein
MAQPSTKPLAGAPDGPKANSSATPYLQTLSDVQMGNPVSLYRICDPTKLSAIRARTSTYDISERFQDACDNGVRHFKAENGLFNFERSVTLDGPLTIDGTGQTSIFLQRGVTDKATFRFRSRSASHPITGIVFRNFTMRCDDGSFAEQQHFIDCNGVSDAVFEGLRLIGFRGDGIYLGSGVGREQRHNQNVHIRSCMFDGVNRENRNAISVIDGDGVFITLNLFARCTRPNMPGPIDFESNANPWHIVRRVRVRENIFVSNGGNVGEVSFVAPSVVASAPNDIEVSRNQSSGYVGTGSFLLYDANRKFVRPDEASHLRVSGNHAVGGCRPFSVINGKGVRFNANRWSDFSNAALVGFVENQVRDVSFEEERFTRAGHSASSGLSIFNVDGLEIRKMKLEDCGSGARGSANAIQFNKGVSRRVQIDDLEVTSPTGKTRVAIQKEASHTFTPATNRLRRARVGSLTSNFQADDSDLPASPYRPA